MVMVGVIGAGNCDPALRNLAYQTGYGLAQAGLTVVCGGLDGVMAGACEGARAAGGTTVGILPGTQIQAANPWVDIAIATGMGEARNAILVHTAQALIAIGGEYGTLTEIGFALKLGKPLIGLQTWQLPRPDQLGPALPTADTPAAAVAWVREHLGL